MRFCFPEGRKRRVRGPSPSWWRDLSTGTCTISHVIHLTRGGGEAAHPYERVHIGRMFGTHICLYVYLTHQTGTHGSTMRNMRSTSSRGTYSRVPRNLYLLSTTYKLQIPMKQNRCSTATGSSSPSGKLLCIHNGETLLHSTEKPRFRRTQTKYIFAIKARGGSRAATPSRGDRDRERRQNGYRNLSREERHSSARTL